MWQTKHFRTPNEQEQWIETNQHRFQIVRLFVNNGYAVEYKKLRIVY